MSSVVNFIRDKHALWYKFLLYLLCTVILVVLLPGESSFKYDTNRLEGNPWRYENLTAPFDFPVYKTEQELKKERDALLSGRKLYFIKNNNTILPDLYNSFIAKQKKSGHDVLCKKIIDTLAGRGIIETSEVTEGKKSDFPVYLIEENVEKEYRLGDFFTLASAYKYVESELEKIPVPERNLIKDSLLNYFSVSIFYNKEFSDKALNQSLSQVLPSRGMIKKGQTIITNGEIVSSEKIKILNSLKKELHVGSESRRNEKIFLWSGHLLIVGLSLGMVLLFLYFFRSAIFSRNSEITFIFILVTVLVFIASRVTMSSKELIFFIPFAIVPIVVRTFFDTRTALFTHLNTIIIASLFSTNGYTFIIVQLFAGIGAIFSVAALSKRSQLLTSIVAVFVSGMLAYFAVNLTVEASTYNFRLSEITPFIFNSVGVLLAYPVIFLSEKSFGFISDFTLLELSGSNSALLRELAIKAPGTFQHSLQVANLAEEAIFKIGGNPLLVRAGALYHDIGKIKNPRYFIENRTGNVNPHEELPYEESAKIIIQHVIDGIELAKANKLPDQIIDFIRTHHGTSATRYFLRHYQLQHHGVEIDEKKFRYPGPIPFSKETAVLMMADSVEAASRSLKTYDAQSVDQLVDQVIDSQIAENQFLNSDITFMDINSIKKIFKRRLMNIYHIRIEYPR